MMNEAKMTELTQAEEMAYFRAGLCLYSPELACCAIDHCVTRVACARTISAKT